MESFEYTKKSKRIMPIKVHINEFTYDVTVKDKDKKLKDLIRYILTEKPHNSEITIENCIVRCECVEVLNMNNNIFDLVESSHKKCSGDQRGFVSIYILKDTTKIMGKKPNNNSLTQDISSLLKIATKAKFPLNLPSFLNLNKKLNFSYSEKLLSDLRVLFRKREFGLRIENFGFPVHYKPENLDTLIEMGFDDIEKDIYFLRKTRGNVEVCGNLMCVKYYFLMIMN